MTLSGHKNRAWLRVFSGQLVIISVLEEVAKRKSAHEMGSTWKSKLHHRKLGLNWKFKPASILENKHSYGEREFEYLSWRGR